MEAGFALSDATVGIIGLGLMGGSLAMSLKGKCARLIGFDTHPATLELALSKGIIDHAETLTLPHPLSQRERGVDILILATPVPSILQTIQQLQISNLQSPVILLDLGSTKRDITQAMSALPANFDPLGGHPICGREKLGLENASADLYKDAPFIITPLERTTPYALRITHELISAIGAHCIVMPAEEHDRILAATSHLPFLIASSLARSTPHDYAHLIGPGFRSTSRLAGTPAHMMLGILKSNRDNVLNAIHTFRDAVDEIECALQSEDYDGLENLLNQSRSSYNSIVDKQTGRHGNKQTNK